jgi:hypothetical protein
MMRGVDPSAAGAVVPLDPTIRASAASSRKKDGCEDAVWLRDMAEACPFIFHLDPFTRVIEQPLCQEPCDV